MNTILEFLPLVVFFIVAKSHGVVMAAGALMASMIAVSTIQFVMQGYKLKKQQWVILGITIIFCSLTLIFRDDVYVKWKTPIINWTFATVLLLSLLFKRQWLRQLGEKFIDLTPKGWINLTWLFIGYFTVLGILHYVFAFYFPEKVWINFKVIWASVISFVFMGGLMFSLRNKLKLDELQQASEKHSQSKTDKKPSDNP